jgi:hypothetical protein
MSSPFIRHDRFQAQNELSLLPYARLCSARTRFITDEFSFLEIIKARWGTVAHIVFMFFGLATNVIVSSKPNLDQLLPALTHQPC